MRTVWLLLAVLLSLPSCRSSDPAGARPIAFVDVNVIPMDADRVVERQTVLVRDAHIVAIGPSAAVRVPNDALQIDGRGKYLMPGLIDMHVHLRSSTELPLYIANGVTTVFNLNGDPVHLRWRERVAQGNLLGPTIYTCGPKFDKPRTPEEAEKEVEAQKRAGYDGIKIYARVSKAEYPALLAAARRNHMLVVGHVPPEVGFEAALAAGQALEHAEEYVYRYFNATLDIDELVFDESRIPAAVKLTRDAGIWFTPTLVTYDQIVQQVDDLDAFLARPEMRFISPVLRLRLEPASNIYRRGFTDAQVPKLKQNLAFQKKLVGALHAAGVPMLAGTDSMGIGTVGGYSLHEELRNFVETGFTPYEALATATINAATFLEASGEIGTVATGKRADLLLLEANPLVDVAATTRSAGVMVRGRWFPERDLQGLLAGLPQAYARDEQIVRDSLHRDVDAAIRFLDEHDPGGALASYVLTRIAIEEGTEPMKRVVTAVKASHPDAVLVQERTINTLGYQLLRQKLVDQAIDVLALNTEVYPGSANTFDSLAEAYDARGDVALAAQYYGKALEVDPGYPNAGFAREYLKKQEVGR